MTVAVAVAVGADVAGRLHSVEERISAAGQKMLAAMIETGAALKCIRDERLYLADGWPTFDNYCQVKWGMRRESVDRMTRDADVAGVLEAAGKELPRSEYALRVVAPLLSDPVELIRVWEEAGRRGRGRITGELLGQVIRGVGESVICIDAVPEAGVGVGGGPVRPVRREVELDELTGELALSAQVVRFVLEPQLQPHWVYRYYDVGGALLYVGFTGDVDRRDAQHRQRSEWYPRAGRCEVERYPDRRSAERREVELILALEPPYNRQNNADRFNARQGYESE